MLLALCVAALLFTLAMYAIAKVALSIMTLLGLEPMTVLLWFGLAERPGERPRAERRRLGELFADAPSASPAEPG
jgi:hypothetical protein